MTEEIFRSVLFNKLKSLSQHIRYKIDIEVPVPYKHIYVKEGKRIVLEIWCFKQDIVFYKPLFEKEIPYKGSGIQFNGRSLISVKLEKDSAQHTKDVGMPYLIIETKNGQPNTHDILTYSRKAEMIKTIFPYCKFVFCIYGRISPRTYRHGLNFDRIESISNIKDNIRIREFVKMCHGLIREAEKDLRELCKKDHQ